MIVYSKVYEDGKLLFPSENWTEDEKNARIPPQNPREDINSLLNNGDCLRSLIYLGDDMEFKAGHKYIFTIDFTNGLGYYQSSDPTHPNEPILNNAISAKVDIEEWADGDEVLVEP